MNQDKKWHNQYGARITNPYPMKKELSTENKKSVSETMQDELEPIIYHPRRKSLEEMQAWEDEGGAIHPTEYDESDDLEDAKVVTDEYRKLEKDMDYSGAFESDVVETASGRWDWYGLVEE